MTPYDASNHRAHIGHVRALQAVQSICVNLGAMTRFSQPCAPERVSVAMKKSPLVAKSESPVLAR